MPITIFYRTDCTYPQIQIPNAFPMWSGHEKCCQMLKRLFVVFFYSINILWGTCGCMMSQWIGLVSKETFVFSCTYILGRYLHSIIPIDNGKKVFVFLSEKISACKKDLRSRMNSNPLWVSGRYTALYHSAQWEERVYLTQLCIRWMLSTALGLRQIVGFQVWGLKNSKVLSQVWMHLKETSISF